MPSGVYIRTAEHRAGISAALTGRTLSDEHKANISAAGMGNQYTLGYKHTNETKAKISAKGMGNQYALGNQNTKGYKHTDAARANMSIASKLRAQTPEGRAGLANASRMAHVRPTRLEKILYKMLDAFGWEYDTEVVFTPYIVDAYIPGLHLALEADGAFHFNGNPFKCTTPEEEAQKTKERDAHLFEHYDLEVWHFDTEQLESIPGE